MSDGKIIINNRYIINKEIGSGGYASVFLAHDKIANKLVAIKVLNCQIENQKAFNMFKQEAMTLAAISNKHIVRVYSNGVYEDNLYLVMEYVKGKSIKQLIVANGYLLLDEVYSYMLQIIDGIEACHNNGIIHRDIKPQNLIKKADGSIVIIDFGTAFINQEDVNLYKEDGSTVIGTAQYMAPELIDNPKGSIQTDIYAIGITMYEMLTGKFPFNPKDPQDKKAILYMHINVPFPSIRKVNPSIPLSFEKLINKCCNKDAKLRYKNVEELKIDLIEAYDNYKAPKKKNFLSFLFRGKK